MCQSDFTIEVKRNKHLKWDNRILIEHLYNVQKKKPSEIAKELKKHRTTIEREIKRGLVKILNSDYTERTVYSADIAQSKHDRNGTAKGPILKIDKDHELAKFIEEKIREKYSPEVIAEMIAKDDRFKKKIHWKTIYNYIDKGIMLIERKDLTYGNYKARKKGNKKENVVKLFKKEGRRITDRPKEAETRKEMGHWEMDTLEGKKGANEPILLVLSERASRQERIILMKDKTQESVIKALNKLERRLGTKLFRETFKTITTDNGSEFLNYTGIETSYRGSKKPRTKQYYADAYSAWQRGTNENTNKLIRRFLPKGQSLAKLTDKDVQRIEDWINNYPRKILGFKSSNEIFTEIAA